MIKTWKSLFGNEKSRDANWARELMQTRTHFGEIRSIFAKRYFVQFTVHSSGTHSSIVHLRNWIIMFSLYSVVCYLLNLVHLTSNPQKWKISVFPLLTLEMLLGQYVTLFFALSSVYLVNVWRMQYRRTVFDPFHSQYVPCGYAYCTFAITNCVIKSNLMFFFRLHS